MPDPVGRFTSHGQLAATFGHFAARRCGTYAPQYARIGAAIAPLGTQPWCSASSAWNERDQLPALVSTRRVQTNEVRRCCYLLPAVMLAAQLAGRPLALIEPGHYIDAPTYYGLRPANRAKPGGNLVATRNMCRPPTPRSARTPFAPSEKSRSRA